MSEKTYPIGYIYELYSENTDKVYIGSTTKSLKERLRNHTTSYRSFLKNGNDGHYTKSIDLFCVGGVFIREIEVVNDCTKKELERREGLHIKNTNNTVNIRVSGRTEKERYEDCKEEILEKKKEYRKKNKKQIAKKTQEYYEANKEKKKQYYEANKEKKKQYYEANKEQIIEKKKQYYEAKKDKEGKKKQE